MLKSILLVMGFANLFAVPARYSHVCFYNWSDALSAAFLILIAAAALWLNTWWSCIVSVIITAPVVQEWCRIALKVHGVLPMTSEEAELYVSATLWRQVIWNHPDEFMQILLAATILYFASISLLQHLFRTQPVPP